MQTLLHRRRPFGDASEGTNDRVGSEDTGDYKILGRLRPKSGHDRLTFQSAKRNYRTGTARRRPGELIGAARIDDHALLLRSVLCYRFSFPIGAANFPRHQSLELIGAEVNQRLSVDKESRGFGHLQGLSITISATRGLFMSALALATSSPVSWMRSQTRSGLAS